MKIEDALRTIKEAEHAGAVYLTTFDGQQVDIMWLKTRRQQEALNGWLQDKHLLRNFVGVYDYTTSLKELRADVAYTAARRAAAA